MWNFNDSRKKRRRKVFVQMRLAMRGMISLWPQPLRQLLEGSRQSEAGDDSARGRKELSAEQASLRKDALLGHLLKLAVKGDGEEPPLAPHALPSLVSQLEAAGLVPRWLPLCNDHPVGRLLISSALDNLWRRCLSQLGRMMGPDWTSLLISYSCNKRHGINVASSRLCNAL